MSLVSVISTLSTTVQKYAEGTLVTQDELNAVTSDQIETIKEVVNEWKMDDFDIDEAARLFGYEGFDPEVVYKSLLASAAKANISDDDLKHDIGLLLVLHHVKGNVTAANFKSFKPQGQDMVNKLFKRYGVTSKTTKDKRRAITLPRIGACFPLQMAVIANTNAKNFIGPYNSQVLPDFMKTSSFPSIIPALDEASKFLQLTYNAYATDQHIALTKKNYAAMDDAEKMELFKEQLKFSDVSYQSPVMSLEGRKRAMTILNIGKFYKEIKLVFDKTKLDASLSVTESKWNECVKKWKLSGESSLSVGAAATK